MATISTIAIIGPGKVGTALGVLAARAGLCVSAVGGGRRCSAQTSARLIGNSVRALGAAEAAGAGELVLLTVPDEAIETLCASLVSAGALHEGQVVAHCCGALGSGVLSAARSSGCQVGSMHPLQTFPTVEAAIARLPEAPCFIEGDAGACETLEEFARSIGCRPMRTTAESKALYHASAAMASNYLVALLDAASGMMASAVPESAGANRKDALGALEPLVRATVDNALCMGTEAALTGPIARGDVQTVKRHLDALKTFTPELQGAYRAMGKLTVDVALRKGTISDSAARRLLALLSDQAGQGSATGPRGNPTIDKE